MEISVFSTPEEIEAQRDDLDILAWNAVEANVSYEWWSLAPALRHLERSAPVIAVVVWGSVSGRKTAIGLFPFSIMKRYSGLPISYYQLWRHTHCLLCTPLLHRGAEQECLKKLFQWSDTCSPGPMLLNFAHVTADGAFIAALRSYVSESKRSWALVTSHERAFLKTGVTAEAYVKALPKKRRKELSRLSRRLSEAGAVTAAVIGPDAPGSEIAEGLEEFLELERSGWKGEKQTAIACRKHELAYFQALTEAATKLGRLSLVKLSLDQVPIAVQCNLHAGDGAFSYKLSFDETHSPCSPGILVAYENLKYVLDRSGLAWMDSGAEPDHPMINRLWYGRRRLASYSVATKRRGALMAFQLIFIGRMLYKLGRKFSRSSKSHEESGDEHSED